MIIHNTNGVPIDYRDTVICSVNADERPSAFLLSLAFEAIEDAFAAHVHSIPTTEYNGFINIYPGEHYRLLRSMMRIIRPDNVFEIGTGEGFSAMAMTEGDPSATITTVDVLPPRKFNTSNIHSMVVRLGDPPPATYLEAADFIFIDGPKDGEYEPMLLGALKSLTLKPWVIIMLDDIRLANMVQLWKDIDRPKLDLTSFGHWSGTGLIDWNGTKIRA